MKHTEPLETKYLEPKPLETNLPELVNAVRVLAKQYVGESLPLLSILRSLEGLHQEIRDGLFQEALPENRQALYSLLRDIEATGGWPYIHRMRLQTLLTRLREEEGEALNQLSPERSTKVDKSDKTPG